MTGFFDKLGLKPQERRLVLGVGIVVFVVLNIWLVRPHFGDVGRWQQRIRDAQRNMARFQAEVAKRPDYQRQLDKLQQGGHFVATDEQALALSRDVADHARDVGMINYSTSPSMRGAGLRTNAFFEEQNLSLTFNNTEEKTLVDFLYRLASGNSLIRVRSMDLRPELPARLRLQGSLTLVESFQKKPPPKPSVAATTVATPKPAASPAKTAAPPAAATTTVPPAKTTLAPVKPASKPPAPGPTSPTSTTNLLRRPSRL